MEKYLKRLSNLEVGFLSKISVVSKKLTERNYEVSIWMWK